MVLALWLIIKGFDQTTMASLSKSKVINSSFYGNSGANGGGIVNLSGSQAEIHNSVLWGNPGGQIALQGTAEVTTTYSLVEGGFSGGEQIITEDPLFVDADGLDDVTGTLPWMITCACKLALLRWMPEIIRSCPRMRLIQTETATLPNSYRSILKGTPADWMTRQPRITVTAQLPL